MYTIKLDITLTLAVAAVLLALGEYIKNRVAVFSRYFIPSPIIGGLIFSVIALIGHETGTFSIEFYDTIRNFLLLVFFTTIGFSASFELLKKGGVGVALFLLCAVMLVCVQNGVGALPAAIAASTYGLVAGCVIGGPVGTLLMRRHHIKPAQGSAAPQAPSTTATQVAENSDDTTMVATILLMVCIGLGTLLVDWLKRLGIVLPAYLGPMLTAALVRNIIDWRHWTLPQRQFEVVGNVSLAFFLVMALMSMKLWELAAVAGPLLVILLVQTAIMFAYAYFVTFRIMGSDYDAAVMACGHCGFGMGATPNAMANMQAFTKANGPSFKAFFVIPLVGSLFIDFFNAVVITGFMGFFK